MELVKQNARMCCTEKCVEKIKTIDEDYNVPDAKSDIRKIICSTYETVIEGMREVEQKEVIFGYVDFDIMYSCQENGRMEHLEGKYTFEETFDMDDNDLAHNDHAKVLIEDFAVKVINSRKVNLKALLTVRCCRDLIQEDSMVVDVKDETMILRKEKLVYTQIKACCEDQYRIKEDIELPKNKPNIDYLIWKDVRLKSHETKLLDDCVYIKGDIGVFVIYKANHEETAVSWYETTVPFEGKIEVSGVHEEMYSFVPLLLQETKLCIKQDADGEERVIAIEGMIKADIKAYSEEETTIVWDMYSCDQHVEVVKEDKNYQQIMIKNRMKVRGYNKVKVGDMDEKPLQICYSYGDVHLERSEVKGNLLELEGCVDTTMVYISSNDESPVAAIRCQVPFEQTITLEEAAKSLDYSVCASIDQINATMISGEEIEIRVFVDVEFLMLKTKKDAFVADVTATPMTAKEKNDMPELVGYVVMENDTLWDVAKKYKTTTEQLQKYNKSNADVLKKGDKLLVVR